MKSHLVKLAAAALLLVACGDDDEVTPNIDGGTDGSVATDGGGDASADAATSGDGPMGGDGPADGAVALTPQQLRGQYLVDNVALCSDCHTPRNALGMPLPGKYMAGAECFVKLPSGACLHSRNLTNDETGLKNRTDDEIKKMFLEGKRPTATGEVALHPIMPYYVFRNLKGDDVEAIVAYLRTIPAVKNELPRKAMEFDLPAPAAPLEPGTFPVPADTYADKAAAMRGRYLAAEAGLCLECHSKHEMGGPTVIKAENYFTGGEEFNLGLPVKPVSKNLTSDVTTGLGNWTVADIVASLKQGKDKDGKGLCPPMPAGPMAAYGRLTDQDANDIAHYIKSLPAKANMIVDMCTWPPGM